MYDDEYYCPNCNAILNFMFIHSKTNRDTLSLTYADVAHRVCASLYTGEGMLGSTPNLLHQIRIN